MNKLLIKLKYCYGINKLTGEFDFSTKGTYAIYSPNGVMKTSFAKTFIDLSYGKDSTDLVFPERDTQREIKDENDDDIKPEEVFVIEPYNEKFNTDKVSTLLVTKELKIEYDEAYQDLEKEKNEFIKKLKAISQSSDCESEFLTAFSSSREGSFFEILNEISKRLDGKQIRYVFKYNAVFDKKGSVKKFLDKHRSSLDLYAENYESLISKSSFFKKSDNTFGTYQATEILRSVSDNSFFDAGHFLELIDSTRIGSAEDFRTLLESEVKKVISDDKLKSIFEKIDKDIGSNAELRSFKSVIEKNNSLLVELKDYENFKKKVWLGYLDQLKAEVHNLLALFNTKKAQLEDIVLRAKKEKTDWERSIREFNERFKGLPFRLSIKNREDVLLKTSTPTVEFTFRDSEGEKPVDRDNLLKILSQGERRALYLLNIIFEVQARKKLGQNTLFIIDDIADSFDYKNKYAIVEYLNDIAKEDGFRQLILSHNFDFYRCVSSRLHLPRENRLHVVKTKDEIKIVEEKYQNNPFSHWKDNLDKEAMLIASIPFVRNLAEFSGYKEEFEKLTSLMHIKNDTNTILVGGLEDIFKSILKDKSNLRLPNASKKVITLIYETADTISTNTDQVLDLENKIVLSIAIRLKAEEFIIKEINDQIFVNQISKDQTIALINKYKELFEDKTDNIDMLDQVNLMTPENIHINSFMYEPILDLGDEHLKDLYKKICKLSQS